MPFSYMLDSSACIHVLRGKAPFDALPDCAASALSSLVAAELWTGAEKSNCTKNIASLKTFLDRFTVLDFGHAEARHYARIRVILERKGTRIGPMDLLIAAHACSLDATLITLNADEFRRVEGLKVEAWG